QDGGGADVLHADAVLRPPDGVRERGRAVAPGVGGDRLAHAEEQLRWDAAHLLDHLGRVARVVALQDLEHAPGVRHRLVALGMALDGGPAGPVRVPLRGLLHALAALRALFVLLVALARGRLHLHPLVLPRGRVVGAVLGVEPAEHAVEVLGVAEVLVDDRRSVGERDDVVAEVLVVLEDVVDDPTEERDVRAGADRDVDVSERAGAREARVDVDQRRATRLGLHHPLEPDRMALGHVRALDDDAVAVLEVLLERRGATTTERCPQTGDGGRMSYARLVLDLDGAERGEELLDEVVLFVVERRPAEVREPERAAHALVTDVPLPTRPPRRDDAVGDHVHRVVEREVLPLRRVRPAVLDAVLTGGAGGELQRRRALRAQPAAADGRVGITLDLRDLAVLDVDELAAPDGAVRAHRLRDVIGGLGTGAQPRRALALHGVLAPQPVAVACLAQHRPRREPGGHRRLTSATGTPAFAPETSFPGIGLAEDL